MEYTFRNYVQHGFSVIPIRRDGTKRPVVPWKKYQSEIASDDEITAWQKAGYGIALVCGAASGNLVVMDFEYFDVFQEWLECARAIDPEFCDDMAIIKTPGKAISGQCGVHLYFRLPEAIPGEKLAACTPDEAVKRCGDPNRTDIIETRGEGQYVLGVGSPESCHPSGRSYEEVPQGDHITLFKPMEISMEIWHDLIALAKVLDAAPKQTVVEPKSKTTRSIGMSPGDDYNQRADWDSILTAHGWQKGYVISSGRTLWIRPGKTEGFSGTTGHCSNEQVGDMFYCFTTNGGVFEAGKCYSKFAAYTFLNHGGDFSKAAKMLKARGFGEDEIVGFDPDDKPELSDLRLPSDLTFPIHIFPNQIAEYCRKVSYTIGSSLDMAACAAIAAAGSALGGASVLQVQGTWTEGSRLYMAVIADPGSAKSPVTNVMMKPISDWQNRKYIEWMEEMAAYEKRKEEFYKNNDGDEFDELPPPQPHYYTTDATTEALVPILQTNPKGILLMMDELSGWIAGMNQYKAKGADRQFWLSAWSGSSIKVDRKGNKFGSMIVPDPYISVFGGIQPDMAPDLCDAKGREDGFVHRLLFSFPEPVPQREVPKEEWLNPLDEFPEKANWNQIINRLLGLIPRLDQTTGAPLPLILTLSPAAVDVWTEEYNRHIRQVNHDDFPIALQGPWAKLRGYAIRLTLVIGWIHMASREEFRHWNRGIPPEIVAHAWRLIDYYKAHIQKVYGILHMTDEERLVQKALNWMKKKKDEKQQTIFTSRDLQRGGFLTNKPKIEDIQKLIRALVSYGHGTSEAVNGKEDYTFHWTPE